MIRLGQDTISSSVATVIPFLGYLISSACKTKRNTCSSSSKSVASIPPHFPQPQAEIFLFRINTPKPSSVLMSPLQQGICGSSTMCFTTNDNWYFYCNRTGSYRGEKCIVHMKAIKDTDTGENVHYCSTHHNHEVRIGHLRIQGVTCLQSCNRGKKMDDVRDQALPHNPQNDKHSFSKICSPSHYSNVIPTHLHARGGLLGCGSTPAGLLPRPPPHLSVGLVCLLAYYAGLHNR